MTKEQILSIVREHHPSSVASLKAYLKAANLDCSDDDLVRLISQLSSEGSIALQDPHASSSLSGFFMTLRESWWIYLIILLSIVEMALVIYGPSDPLSELFRLVLGIALLGFFPGYSTFTAVFPHSDLSFLEKVVMSIFLSLLVSILTGTILGTVMLLQAASNVTALAIFSVVMALVASYRSVLTKQTSESKSA